MGLITDRNPETQISANNVDHERLVVRRIDLVDSDGVIRMTLAGELPNPVVDGIEYERSSVISGIMLRDDSGNERGGFGYNERLGGPVLALDHDTAEGVGMALRQDGEAFMWVGERPEPLTHPSLPGRTLPGSESPSDMTMRIGPDGNQSIALTDGSGQTRLRLTVTESGYGAIEFLNSDGEVIETFAPEAQN